VQPLAREEPEQPLAPSLHEALTGQVALAVARGARHQAG
jgi:hypothetical protein